MNKRTSKNISYVSDPTFLNRLGRVVWNIVYIILYKPSPTFLHSWRCFLLRIFGANIGVGVHPYPLAKVWLPKNLTMENYSCLANNVDCYNVAEIVIAEYAIVSQYAYLCSATHDYNSKEFHLQSGKITIGKSSWIAAGAFIGPGVTINEYAVVGARAVCFKNVDGHCVVAGNPACVVGKREYN